MLCSFVKLLLGSFFATIGHIRGEMPENTDFLDNPIGKGGACNSAIT
jgi:hypothetical protein